MAGVFGASGSTRGRGAAGPRPPIRGASGYVLAVAGVAAATHVRTALDPLLGEAAPYVTYFTAALALFLAAGLGPALLGAVLGGLAGTYLFVEPRGSFEPTRSGAAALALYLLVVAATLWVVRSLREARATAERRQAELLAAEAAVRAQRETWRATLASIAEAVVATDRDGRVAFLNGEAERLLGLGAVEAADRSLAEVLPLVGLGDEALDRALRRGEVFAPDGPLDLPGRGRQGPTPVEVVASPIRGDGAGEVLGIVVVLRDVSAARRVADELGEAKEAAEAANRAKDRFLAALGHELRTPLTPALLGVSYMLEGAEAPAPLRPIFEMIRRNIEAEARLIDDLLDVVQIQRGALVGMPRTADVHALIRRAVADCRAALDGAGVETTLDLEADPHHVWADPDRLRQAIVNLLRNAAKFSPGGGRVAVRTRSEPGTTPRLVVEVADAGVGLAPEALAMLFQPFDLSRRDPMTGGAGGLGLGLAICRAIVAGAGWTIAASSPGLGLGATFTLTFPAVPAPSQASGAPPAPSVDGVAAGPLRILVVDDDEPTRRALTVALASLGHTVATADSVASASEAVRGEFDVLLCDIGLPDGTGYDVLRLIDSRPVRAIALSGFGLDDDLRRSRASGFAEHLTKPVDLGTLEAAIRRAAGGA
ncbi:MAG TPA: ATP-binding protein [Isosphaeraceae bacterium]